MDDNYWKLLQKTMKVGKSFNLGVSKPTYDGISQYFKQTPT